MSGSNRPIHFGRVVHSHYVNGATLYVNIPFNEWQLASTLRLRSFTVWGTISALILSIGNCGVRTYTISNYRNHRL